MSSTVVQRIFGIPEKGIKRSLYWRWRLSLISRPFYFLLTWLELIVRARKLAVALDNCMRALGQMHHVDYRCPNKDCENCKKVRITDDRMTMTIAKRSELLVEAHKILPARKFRHD